MKIGLLKRLRKANLKETKRQYKLFYQKVNGRPDYKVTDYSMVVYRGTHAECLSFIRGKLNENILIDLHYVEPKRLNYKL